MRKTVAGLVMLLFVALVGCAAEGPNFAAATLPPLPPGQARIFFYRWNEPYEALSMSKVYLNGDEIAVSQIGAVLYRDVAPGPYYVSVQSQGTYPDQFKTVVIGAGQTFYIRIESISSYKSPCGYLGNCEVDTFVVSPVDPTTAAREMYALKLIPG
jgi:hypothetical protein